MLAHAVQLRYAPELIFYLDETLDKAMKLENLFHKIHEQDSQKEEENKSTEI